MQSPEQLINDISAILRKIKTNKSPALTESQKQAAILMTAFEKIIMRLLAENLPQKVICLSLFYFWLQLETPRGVSKNEFDRLSESLPEVVESIMEVVKTTLKNLPAYHRKSEMKELAKKIDLLKSFITEEYLERELP